MYICLLFSALMTAELRQHIYNMKLELTNIYPSAPDFALDFQLGPCFPILSFLCTILLTTICFFSESNVCFQIYGFFLVFAIVPYKSMCRFLFNVDLTFKIQKKTFLLSSVTYFCRWFAVAVIVWQIYAINAYHH